VGKGASRAVPTIPAKINGGHAARRAFARPVPLSYCVTHFVVCVLKLYFRNMDIVAVF
jgi:hypothetical protein